MLFFMWNGALAGATDYIMPMAEWAPWTIKPVESDGELSGVLPDLNKVLLKDLIAAPTPQITSMVRIQEGVDSGLWTWLYFYCSLDNASYYKFTEPVVTVESALFVNADSSFRKPSDLLGARVATAGRAQYLLPPLLAQMQFEIINTVPQGFILLQRRRVDAVLTSLGVAHWLAKHKEMPAPNTLRMLRIPEAKIELCLFANVKTPLSDRTSVHERLQKLRASGELNAISAPYIGEP